MKKIFTVALMSLSLIASVSAQADCQQAYMKKVSNGNTQVPLFLSPVIPGDVAIVMGLSALGAASVVLYSALTGIPLVVGGIVALAIHEHKVHLLNMVRVLDQADWLTGVSPQPQATDKVSAREIKEHSKAFWSFYLAVAKQVPGVTPAELAQAVSTANASGDFCNGVIKSDGRKASAGALASRGQAVKYFARVLK